MLKRVLLISAANAFMLCSVNPSFGADVAPEPAVSDWTGIYLGGNVGYAWADFGSQSVDFTSDGYDPGPDFSSSSSSDFIGGIHAGANYQIDQIVLGVEGDFELTSLDQQNDGTLLFLGVPFGNSTTQMNEDVNWLASARLRLGYAAGNFMPYLTGGVALADIKYSGFVTNNVDAGGGPGPFSENKNEFGWVVGGGLEYKAFENWTIRGEYLHYDFGDGGTFVGDTNPTFVFGAAGVFDYGDTTIDVVKLGVSYLFGGS
jgi:outer membrane immunogenic protein